MNSLRLLPVLFLLISIQTAFSQKRPLDHEDILHWNRITEQRISNNGAFIVYKTELWKGDPCLFVSKTNGESVARFNCGTRSAITEDSKFVVFSIQPETEVVRELKLKKAKKEEMPKAKLAVYDLNAGKLDTLGNLKSFELPAKWAGFLAYQVEKDKVGEKAKEGKEGKEDEKGEKKIKEPSDKNGFELVLRNLNTRSEKNFPFVTQYKFAEEKELLVFVSTGIDSVFAAGMYAYWPLRDQLDLIIEGEGLITQLVIKEDGAQIGFLADMRSEKDRKGKESLGLYYWADGESAQRLADQDSPGIQEGWEISKNGRLSFSPSGKRLFLGLAPVIPEKDSSLLEEELPVLDIWTWNEPELQTVQLKNKSRDEKKSYLTVFSLETRKLIQLETPEFSGINLIREGDGPFAVASSNLPYSVQSMWEGSPTHNDIYLVDLLTGQARLIKKDLRAYPQVSPGGRYLYWYQALDTSWISYDIAGGKEYLLCTAKEIQTADELNDIPNPAGSYGSAGWLENDQALLIYDRFNIWQLDPENKKAPENLTQANRQKGMAYRIIDFDRRKSSREGIDPKDIRLLSGHNEITREDGFFAWSMKKRGTPEALLYGPFNLGSPQKAKDAEVTLFTREDFETFPDLQVSDLNFKNLTRISEANPQQKEFLWGTAELVTWTSLDGRKLEGTLHKPENFDPSKKYPLIVNFYEKSSQGLFGHHIPERGRSTIDYHYYTSNGYLIFNPDVYYKEGYPGEDAFNCVMPGITALIEKGFVNEKAIAAQGHSWGGYQVAYLATRTNLFACIESGAPVVNMFSAYGGIRWGSGLNRSFQYEHTQSRIGKSIWESPLRYLENSPIFTMDKVQTPILIMANDDDGAVPWYQGIEYFIALRRLGKPAWLLNYNNADHWPTRLEDKHDFQIRLAQFFDHYLKGAPMPEWMEKGIPAVEKGRKLGY